MKINKFKYIFLSGLFLFPFISFAALDGVKGFLTSFRGLLNTTVPVIFGLCLIYFFWGVAQFILHDAGNATSREEGKKKILWGFIALFIFVSLYGILNLIGDTIDLDNSRIDIPNINPFNPSIHA